MIIIVFLCLCLATNNCIVDGRITSISQDHEDLELERQLKLINKPPLKSIQTEFGYIVDCIDIYKQPAFDNPLLKNHNIQLKPSFQDTRSKLKEYKRSASSRLSNIGIEEDLCPKGTVPIRRTTKDDLIRAKQLSNVNAGILTKDVPGSHFAEVYLNEGGPYYGISGIIDTNNPPVSSQDQSSSAYIYLSNGPSFDDVNIIMAGWQVYPALFGDDKTYFFTSWADNTRHTGCYNMLCAGFVQVDTSFPIGSPMINTSVYDGPQFDMSLALSQDAFTQNWWVTLQNKKLGYFPAILFSNLTTANIGGWTGRTMTTVGSTSPPMGSGHFPDGNIRHASYIREMTFQNETKIDIYPIKSVHAEASADSPSCYNVEYYGYEDETLGYAMLFGGPGGNCGD